MEQLTTLVRIISNLLVVLVGAYIIHELIHREITPCEDGQRGPVPARGWTPTVIQSAPAPGAGD
jgi:hypothetical protein